MRDVPDHTGISSLARVRSTGTGTLRILLAARVVLLLVDYEYEYHADLSKLFGSNQAAAQRCCLNYCAHCITKHRERKTGCVLVTQIIRLSILRTHSNLLPVVCSMSERAGRRRARLFRFVRDRAGSWGRTK
jgi:hypothetical protein